MAKPSPVYLSGLIPGIGLQVPQNAAAGGLTCQLLPATPDVSIWLTKPGPAAAFVSERRRVDKLHTPALVTTGTSNGSLASVTLGLVLQEAGA